MVRVPAGLDAPAKTLWSRVVSDLAQREVLRDVDSAAVERYVRAEMVARQAWTRVAKRAKTLGADAWRARGSHGGWVVDIDVTIARNATRDAAQFAGDLGITPKARAQLRAEAPMGQFDWELSQALGERNRR